MTALIRKWMDHWTWCNRHEDHQFDFYRCELCRAIITWKRIRTDGCCACGSARMRPAGLRMSEKLRILVMPWSV